MVDFVEEQMARKQAVRKLGIARRYVTDALPKLYDHSSGYAGEVESVREAIDNAVRALNGEPPE